MHVQARVRTLLRCALRCALILLFLLLGCGISHAETRAGYNVLLISLDTLRADHLSCYGYKRATSPRIDQVAKEGTLFENVVAASNWTVPSHMSLLTSLYPSVHGVTRYGHVPRRIGPHPCSGSSLSRDTQRQAL